MRKLLISLMAAGMLVPAAVRAEEGGFLRGMRNQADRSSQRDNDSDHRSSRPRASQRGERSSSDRPARVEQSPREFRASQVDHVRRVDRADDGDRGGPRVERIRRADRDGRRLEPGRRGGRDVEQVEQVEVTEPVRRTRRTERRDDALVGVVGGTNDRDNHRDWRRDGDGDGDRDWRRDRDGDRDWRRDRDGRHRWDRDWRRDHRYNWWSYRNRYRSLFRLGRYHDPYGWGYRRFSIGLGLWPSYYGSSFWLNDPWKFRLPPVYGPYRWIRYYDDALLVNIYTGHIVDVVHNVFW